MNCRGGVSVEFTGHSQETDDEIIERKKREFEEKMAAGELDEDDPEYQAFLEKFEAKKTTDDCYTPEVVYEAVANWVANEYGLSRANFVRPFYPGGDYQRENYPNDCVVVDNPPFSILSEIASWYASRGIRFFLFGPHLTLFGTCKDKCAAICVDVSVTYANGANVSTSFLTNLEPDDVVFRSSPTLYRVVADADETNRRSQHVELPKYHYPPCIITTPPVARYSKYGIDFVARNGDVEFIRALDSQRPSGKAIFGSGYIMSTKKTEEREKAEREKAEREKAEREKAEREKAERWELSERELEIIARLDTHA